MTTKNDSPEIISQVNEASPAFQEPAERDAKVSPSTRELLWQYAIHLHILAGSSAPDRPAEITQERWMKMVRLETSTVASVLEKARLSIGKTPAEIQASYADGLPAAQAASAYLRQLP